MCVCVFAEEPLPSAYSRSRREQHANKIGSKQEESLFPSQTLFLSLSFSLFSFVAINWPLPPYQRVADELFIICSQPSLSVLAGDQHWAE